MTPQPVVSNSSPLIALHQIGQLDLLRKLFTSITIPPAVVAESTSLGALPAWIVPQNLMQTVGKQIALASVGPGESEAISLALELRARWTIIDDRAARRLAEGLGLPLIGTLGILLAAKRQKLILNVRPCLESLLSFGFRLAPDLYERVIQDAGEG